jgi:hypothetical protein
MKRRSSATSAIVVSARNPGREPRRRPEEPPPAGGAGEGVSRLLSGGPLRHGFPESPLLLGEQCFSFADGDIGPVTRLLAHLDQVLRRPPDGLRSKSHFGRQHGAAVEMSADILGEVLPAPGTEVRASPAEQITGQCVESEALIAGQAASDDVRRAVEQEEGPLLHGQGVGPLAVEMRETAVGRLDDVSERDRQ